ncbi:hypothetical protein [Pedobacter panaciterrae]
MKKILGLFILLLIISCSGSSVKMNDSVITKLAEGDFNIPSRHGFLDLFVSFKQKEKGATDVNSLHQVFTARYSGDYAEFKSFLSDALNQKLIFNKNDFNKKSIVVFALDDRLEKEFQSNQTEKLLIKYCNDKGNGKFSVKKEYLDRLHSLLYCFFIDNYQITADDLIGEYMVSSYKF